MSRVDDLRQQLLEAEREENAEREQIRKATKPNRIYRIEPHPRMFDRIWDPTIIAYLLTSEITNVEECKAAGHSDWSLGKGSASYLFNTGTNSVIGSFGGGTWYHKDTPRTMHLLSEFLRLNPNGGDITFILHHDSVD